MAGAKARRRQKQIPFGCFSCHFNANHVNLVLAFLVVIPEGNLRLSLPFLAFAPVLAL